MKTCPRERAGKRLYLFSLDEDDKLFTNWSTQYPLTFLYSEKESLKIWRKKIMSLGFEPSPLFSTLSRSCADQYLWRVVWLSGVPQGTAPSPQGIKMPSVKTERFNSLPEKNKRWLFPGSPAFQCSALSVLRSDIVHLSSFFALIGVIFLAVMCLVIIFCGYNFSFHSITNRCSA